MRVVQQHSSFINCTYLDKIADHFNIPEAKRNIDAYQKFVEVFCEHKLPNHSYVASFFAHSKHLLSTETIIFKLEWSPNEKTLADIQSLLRKTFKRLASHIHIVVVGEG